MIFPGIPARTFATSFISGAYQERKVVAGQLRLHSSNRHNSI
jgi:hypothetical protein